MVENLLVILNKRRSQKIYKSIDVHFVTNIVGESIFFSKHVEYCESVR